MGIESLRTAHIRPQVFCDPVFSKNDEKIDENRNNCEFP